MRQVEHSFSDRPRCFHEVGPDVIRRLVGREPGVILCFEVARPTQPRTKGGGLLLPVAPGDTSVPRGLARFPVLPRPNI
jgi:hypothetical protein